MIKLKLKRKISGRAIKKDKRRKELYMTKETKIYDPNTDSLVTMKYDVPKHRRDYSYDKNKPQKRYKDNPNVYKGEKSVVSNGLSSVHVPRKVRKTAWKRFKKNFPHIEVTDTGGKVYIDLRRIEPFPLNPSPKKKI